MLAESRCQCAAPSRRLHDYKAHHPLPLSTLRSQRLIHTVILKYYPRITLAPQDLLSLPALLPQHLARCASRLFSNTPIATLVRPRSYFDPHRYSSLLYSFAYPFDHTFLVAARSCVWP
jgi:hypothetical protein